VSRSHRARSRTVWLAGWLFADLFLVLMLVFLLDRPAPPEVPGDIEVLQVTQPPEVPPVTQPTVPSRPPGLSPASIRGDWSDGQLRELVLNVDRNQEARDRLRTALGEWMKANGVIRPDGTTARAGIALIFTRPPGAGVSGAYSEKIAELLCESFGSVFEVPRGSQGTGLDRCGTARNFLRTYYTGGDPGDMVIELWVYE
jgi:hypothetical protein